MIRMTVAGVGGFILVFLESYLVMLLKGYYTIDFGGMAPFISVWAMNFFLLFTIFTDVKLWQEEKRARQETSI